MSSAHRNPGELSPLTAGAIGSVVPTWVTFVPCFLFVFVGAPFSEYLKEHPRTRGALNAISAAVVGVVLNLAVWFAIHTVFAEVSTVRAGPVRLLVPELGTVSVAAAILGVAATVAMLRYRVGMIATLFGAAACGLLYTLVA